MTFCRRIARPLSTLIIPRFCGIGNIETEAMKHLQKTIAAFVVELASTALNKANNSIMS